MKISTLIWLLEKESPDTEVYLRYKGSECPNCRCSLEDDVFVEIVMTDISVITSGNESKFCFQVRDPE